MVSLIFKDSSSCKTHIGVVEPSVRFLSQFSIPKTENEVVEFNRRQEKKLFQRTYVKVLQLTDEPKIAAVKSVPDPRVKVVSPASG